MSASDLREVRAVTANYFFWQGLRWVPMGLALLATGAAFIARDALPRAVREWGPLLLILIALWLSTSVLGRYYRRTFGQVRADPEQHRRRTSIKWFVVYPAIVVSMIVDMKLTVPIVLSGIAWAAGIEAFRQSTGGQRWHYTVASVVLCVVALLPLAGVIPTGKDGMSILIAAVGLVYVVGGVLDHQALVRILGSAPTET
jgi:hypothetical protein